MEANQEKISKCKAKHYENNKQKIITRSKKYRELNKERNKEKLKLATAKYNEKNKARINKPCDCSCGSQYTYANKFNHESTKKHQKYELHNKQFLEIIELHDKSKLMCKESTERFNNFIKSQ